MISHPARVLPWCLAVAAFLSSCGGGTPPPIAQVTPIPTPVEPSQLVPQSTPLSEDDPLVAEWKGGKLYLSQIDRLAGSWTQPNQAVPKDATSQAEYRYQERKRIVETLVANYLLLLEARARLLQLNDADVERLLSQAKGQFQSEEEYHNYLKQANQTETEFIRVLYNIELGKKCVEDEQEKMLQTITPETMKAYYDQHIKMFTPPHRVHLNQVDIHAGEKRTLEDARALADKLYAEVNIKMATETDLEAKRNVMREYARTYSDSWEGQYNGGYMTPYLDIPSATEAFSVEFLDTAKRTAPGELSPVIRTREGFGFFLVKEQYPSVVHPFESDVIQNMLPNMMMKDLLETWREQLKKQYELKMYDDRMRK